MSPHASANSPELPDPVVSALLVLDSVPVVLPDVDASGRLGSPVDDDDAPPPEVVAAASPIELSPHPKLAVAASKSVALSIVMFLFLISRSLCHAHHFRLLSRGPAASFRTAETDQHHAAFR